MAQINSHIFREYDIRGVAGEDLTVQGAELIGKAVGTYLKQRGQSEVIVGRDCRLSSPEMCKALIAGLNSTGCTVKDIGLASWGFVNYALRQEVGNAVFVSASHNPAKYNGFKIVVQRASINGGEIKKLLKIIETEEFEISDKAGSGKYSELNLLDRYVSFLKGKIKVKRKLKVVIDCGNGMGALVGPRVFKELGCDVTVLYGDLDGRFPNHPADPSVPENLVDLIAAVKKHSADFGVAFDGDGDRIGVVDENGSIIYCDELTAIFAKEILSRKPGSKIVFEVNCSLALAEVIKKHGGIPLEAPVGHSILEEVLAREKAPLAGEVSGHIFFADDFYGVDDAVYVALRLLQFASNSSGKVSSFLGDYPRYFSSLQFRPFCADEKKHAIVEALTKEFKAEEHKVSTIDGAKVLFEDGWGLVRVSNTGPQLTLRFEGKTESAMQRIKALFFDKLKQHGVEVESK